MPHLLLRRSQILDLAVYPPAGHRRHPPLENTTPKTPLAPKHTPSEKTPLKNRPDSAPKKQGGMCHGRDNIDVSQSLNNLAMVYQNQGRYGDAEPLYQRSSAIFEKALGRDHHNSFPSATASANRFASAVTGTRSPGRTRSGANRAVKAGCAITAARYAITSSALTSFP
jgi:Tetratricopeptide repeat